MDTKTLVAKAKQIAASPQMRPLEQWAYRALIAYVAIKLGIKLA